MKIIEVTSENFEKEVLNSNVPVLVDFYADWCGPCKMLRPILEEIASEKEEGKIKFASLNVDEAEDIAMKYNVSSIPCLVLIEGGKEVKRSVGLRPKDDILNMLGE